MIVVNFKDRQFLTATVAKKKEFYLIIFNTLSYDYLRGCRLFLCKKFPINSLSFTPLYKGLYIGV